MRKVLQCRQFLAICALTLLIAHSAKGEDRYQPEIGLQITNPSDGVVVRPGEVVHIGIRPVNDFVPVRIEIESSSGSKHLIPRQEYPRFGRAFRTTYDVPTDARGQIKLVAVGVDRNQVRTTSSAIFLQIESSGPLVRLVILNNKIDLDGPKASEKLVVRGLFEGGNDKNLGGSVHGTTYQSTDPEIATVDAEGNVRAALRDGRSVVVATNGLRSSFSHVFVYGVNGSPKFEGVYDPEIQVGDRLELHVSAVDPEGTIPSLRSNALPAGANFLDNGNGSGVLHWAPVHTDVGYHDVQLIATDATDPDIRGGAWIVIKVVPSESAAPK